MSKLTVDPNSVQSYQAQGAVLIPGLLSDWVDTISAGIEKNIDDP